MRARTIVEFLRLFPAQTRRAFAVALVLSAALSMVDIAALVLLYPVFGALASGAAPRMPLLGGLLSGVSVSTLVVVNIVLMLGRSAAGLAYRLWWGRQVADAEVRLSSRLLATYVYAPYPLHLRRNSADLLARCVNHVNLAASAGLGGLVMLVMDVTTVAAVGVAMFLTNAGAAAVVCGYLAAVGLLVVVVTRRFVNTQAQRFTAAVAQVYERTTTVLRGIRELTVAGGRDAALRSVETARGVMTGAQRLMLVLTDVPRLILEVALYLALLIGVLTVLGGANPQAMLPVAALYVVAGLRLMPALARGLGNLTNAQAGIGIARRLSAELHEVAATSPPQPRVRAPLPRRATLHVEGVSFAYDSGPAVLRDVDLSLAFGTYAVILGPSGAGKSTLLALMLGLLSPTTGRVAYGDVPVGVADARWLRQVSYVPQDVFILDDSVLANVALGDVAVSQERVWSALTHASLADLVRELPDGLQTRLGEAGCRLSAGQRQRLGLARALYRDPAVLVLDEPTAALDSVTQAQVMRTIEALRGTVTIILVTHRPEIVGSAEMVLRLDGGRLEPQPRAGRRSVESPISARSELGEPRSRERKASL